MPYLSARYAVSFARLDVHRLGVPLVGMRGVALVLDADGVRVETLVVPGDVLLVDHLHDVAVARARDVVRRDLRRGILEPRHVPAKLPSVSWMTMWSMSPTPRDPTS